MTPDEESEWLAWRREGLGASDVAKSWTGVYGGSSAVVASKLGIGDDTIRPELAARGHRWEEPLADAVTILTGHPVVAEQGRAVHDTEPLWRCTVDGVLLPVGGGDGPVAGLEIKTRGDRAPWQWPYWETQCQWSMFITGLPRWLLAIATIDTDHDQQTGQLTEVVTGITYRWIDRDGYKINQMQEHARWLWSWVELGKLPLASGAGALPYVKAANVATDPETVADIDDLAGLIARREQIKAALKAAEEEDRTIEAQIRQRMGAATEATTSDGAWRVRCGTPVRRFTDRSAADFLEVYAAEATELGLIRPALDRDKAKALMPEAYDGMRIATPDRRLTVKSMRVEVIA